MDGSLVQRHAISHGDSDYAQAKRKLLAALADLGARVVRELEQPAEELERVGGRLSPLLLLMCFVLVLRKTPEMWEVLRVCTVLILTRREASKTRE